MCLQILVQLMSKFMKTHPPVLKLLYADRRTWSSNTSVLATFQCKCAETRINLYWYHHGENFWIDFYDRMTVHCSRFLGNKTNRCTEFQFYRYNDSTCFGQPFCPSSGVLIHNRLWYTFYAVVMTVCYQEQDIPSIHKECVWAFRCRGATCILSANRRFSF